jgi:hypothetical protein
VHFEKNVLLLTPALSPSCSFCALIPAFLKTAVSVTLVLRFPVLQVAIAAG